MLRDLTFAQWKGVLCVILLAGLVSSCLRLPPVLGDGSVTKIDWQMLEWSGIERVYGIYVPETVLDPAPLVFVLHGGGGSASKTWSQEHGRSWQALADEHGFVLVLPEGISDPGDTSGHHWNDCRTGLDPAVIATTEDDVGFIMHLIENVSTTTAIDAARVYATGASNGGMMTYRLAIEAGQQFAAVAAIIANLPDPSACGQPSVPIPMLIMNGTDDPVMPDDGGCVANASCQRGRVLSTLDTVSFWVGANGAASDPTVVRLPNRAWFDNSRVTVYRFDGGSQGADVIYYRVLGGGHNVPGFESDSRIARAIAGPKNRDIDGPTEIWAFFQRYEQP
ncbi:prolyl oligopeptidase family serine peptidase [Candidatus Bipolaricaulota bacterium]|nr:prolyl oligopeptidase family serine peptidase [Candidatus Bipolaricaulota bacterium]